jgi:hypothetical protein
MSILGKLTVGAMAILGAYALRGKNGKNAKGAKGAKDRKAISRPAGDATPPADDKRASRRAKPKASAATRAGVGSGRPRSAKASRRKRTAS